MAETLLQKAQRLGIKPQNAGQPSPVSVTPPQSENLVQKAQRLGIQPANPPIAEPKQPGFVQGLAQAIAKPFLKTATGIYQGAAGLGNLAQAGVAKLRGDEAGVQKQLADAQRATESGREFDFGYFGKVKGFQPDAPLSTQVKEAVGTGLEMGATLLPAGKLPQLGKLTLGGKVLQGAKLGVSTGAKSGALIGSGQALQEDAGLGETALRTATGGLIGAAGGLVLGGATPLASKAIQGVPKIIKAPGATIRKALPKPENIMNRVARLKPGDAQKFQQLAGETHGKYLQRTGNFGTPEKIVENEAIKFANSLNSVDDALAKLPGTHKSTHLNSILDDLIKREKQIGVADKETNIIKNLFIKNKAQGLDMSEINQAKRIYERTVKLGYQKEQNAIGIARSTRLDSALRNWQVETANKLGLKNLPEMNKQTQLSKFIVDKLGKQLTGKTGNEAISLTDWIILSGGDPTAISAFFAKKLLLNKGMQAGVAKALSGKPVEPIKAQFGTIPQTTRKGTLPPKLQPNKLEKSLPKTLPQPKPKGKLPKPRGKQSGKIRPGTAIGVGAGITGALTLPLVGKGLDSIVQHNLYNEIKRRIQSDNPGTMAEFEEAVNLIKDPKKREELYNLLPGRSKLDK